MRILLVDDSKTMRNIQKAVLTQLGHQDVQEACDGQDALAKLASFTPELLLVDWNMPNMDGITLIRHLRQLPDYRFTPLLMLTTEAGLDKKQEGKAAGATGWLVKPFNPEQLVATLRKVLG